MSEQERLAELDAYWAARDQAREDEMDAIGEPDRDGPWLVAGRRAVWDGRRSA